MPMYQCEAGGRCLGGRCLGGETSRETHVVQCRSDGHGGIQQREEKAKRRELGHEAHEADPGGAGEGAEEQATATHGRL